jgi:hypothetical protein
MRYTGMLHWSRILTLCLLFISLSHFGTGQSRTDVLLDSILRQGTDSTFKMVLQAPETYRLQIIYTQIDRDKNNKPQFKNYYFHVDPQLYFNPASTVKLPLACLTLEKLYHLNVRGVDKYTVIQYDSVYSGQTTEYHDSTAEDGYPSLAQFIRKAFLVSDNDSYNRMYEFVGQQTINEQLHKKGYSDIRICRQFMPFSEEQNRHTNPIRFIDTEYGLIWKQPPAYNTDSFDFSHMVKIGNAHYEHDSLIMTPMDFTRQNNISLEDLQQILQSVMFPESVPDRKRFGLSAQDYAFLYRYLSQYPSETNYPGYDTSAYYDSYVKFYFKNGGHHLPDGIRVFNKVGWSYGFLIDISYVADFRHRIEYMLSTVVYVNSDGILNDDKYDYDSIGYPFLYMLGQTIYNYDLRRSRKYKPRLNQFIIKYDHRNLHGRPPVKNIDN